MVWRALSILPHNLQQLPIFDIFSILLAIKIESQGKFLKHLLMKLSPLNPSFVEILVAFGLCI